ENLMRQAERRGELALGCSLREGLVAAIDLEPTSPAQISLRSRFRDQRLMLRSRAGKQRPRRLGKFDPALKRRIGTIGQKPWRNLRQEAQVVVRRGGALERDPQQRRKAARKWMRQQRAAFDDAGVAVGRFLARPAPVDERDREPALREMQCDRRADD